MKSVPFPSLFIFLMIALVACQQSRQDTTEQDLEIFLQQQHIEKVQLPNGWSLTPVGERIPVGDLPLNAVLSPDGTWMAVANNGQSGHSLMILDVAGKKVTQTLPVKRAYWGLDISEDGEKIFLSGGYEHLVWVFGKSNGNWALKDSIVLGTPWPTDSMAISGLAWHDGGQQVFAVTKDKPFLLVGSLGADAPEAKVALPAPAYNCVLSPDESRLYVSVWGGRAVRVYHTGTLDLLTEIAVGSHPNDMVLTADGKWLFVATANDNGVSLIDTESGRVVETLETALYPDAPAGSTPNGLALSPDEHTLFIANANNNNLAVFDVEEKGESTAKGFIPTGWYPTDVEAVEDQLWIANGKGFSSLANPKGPNPYGNPSGEPVEYIGGLFKGAMTVVDVPKDTVMDLYSRLVYANVPYEKDKESAPGDWENNPIPSKVGEPSPIKYVFYVVKENRTYDQVLGDIPGANGDPSICLFPDSVTPNQHALAREFALLDNFYVNAEVSADGHNWSMGAYANDFVEKTWPVSYGGRGGSYVFEGTHEIAYPDEGYIWDLCRDAGLSYRTYGIFADRDETRYPALKGHASPIYPGYDLTIKDTLRIHRWKQEFDSLLAIDAVPRFNSIRLGNDHTAGARLGMPTPSAMVADNDLAVGLLVEYLSNSPIWKESVVFVVEDDAQNGPDHVDAHRSIVQVVSPYTRRNTKVSELYTTCSVLRTIELILGLPPMSQFDAAATPMWACFQNEPDLTPFQALPNQIDLDELNAERNELSDRSARVNLFQEDVEPEVAFNEVIWKTVRGMDSEMPAPKRSAFLRFNVAEEEGE